MVKNYVNELNIKQTGDNLPVLIEKYQNILITKNETKTFNSVYLFLQKYIMIYL